MTILGQMLVDMGVEQGMEQGMEQGIKKGVKQGIKQGELISLIRLTIRKYRLGQTEEEIARDLLEKQERIEAICRIAKKHPEYEEEQIYTLLTGEYNKKDGGKQTKKQIKN